MEKSLLEKYNVSVPRYTSYPPVPMWEPEKFSTTSWMQHVAERFAQSPEISLYIHLPYCEQLCTYCGCNKHITKNHLVEIPYIKALLREFRMYTRHLGQKPVLKELHLGGGTPTFFAPQNLALLMEGLLQDCELPEQPAFSFEAHPHSTSYEHLATLRQWGFNRLSLGVQDFDPGIMRIINREQSEQEIELVTEQARELGYESINYDLIYGLPGQRPEHMAYNLEKLQSLKPERIAFYSYAHVPAVKPSQMAYGTQDLPSPSEKIALYQQGKSRLEAMGYLHIGMDHFALPEDSLAQSMKAQTLHRNFMGYTDQHTGLSLALGASAISDSWTAYAQNEKKLKDYLLRVRKEEQPPVMKGHLLGKEDLAVRRHILNLMCQFETDWLDSGSAFDLSLKRKFSDLEADGLVVVFPRQVKVTPLGINFIRNICAVLDQRFTPEGDKRPTFSKAV